MPPQHPLVASVVTASIETQSNVVHMVVEELDTKFGDYATVASNPFNGSSLRNTFGTFYRETVSVTPDPQFKNPRLVFLNRYDMSHQYLYPIKRLDRLNIRLYNEQGSDLTNPISPTFITFKFKCLRTNLC